MEEATREIIRGISSHYECAGLASPDHVTRAVEAARVFTRSASSEKSICRYQARLWIFGDAVGAACWRKGYDACRQQMTPAEGKIRIDLAAGELLQLTSLVHLGFRKMMPNDRGIERGRGPRARGLSRSIASNRRFRISSGRTTTRTIVRH